MSTTDNSLFHLEGKSALLVGGGEGISLSTARLLAQAGCGVAVADIDAGRAVTVAAEVDLLGQPSVSLAADMLDDVQVATVFERADQELGGIDLLVTIIGQGSFNPITEMTAAQWDRDHRMNLRYFFLNAQLAARSMIARGAPGSIVCISSVEGMQSAPNHASYGAAKAGLINLVRSMAVELAPHHIRVNSVAPGSIATPRIPASPERVKRTAEGLIPFKRLGETDEVAKAVLFLLSDMASYVTGHTLLVDGGWMAANTIGVPPIPEGGVLDARKRPTWTGLVQGSEMKGQMGAD
ncbi:MAG: SDR family NAD(P)-dependent oxidoreductase [Chloroflexi bacterium]|nr:SDR family NAD(P)-dependent oxidoreductase [Chloroflexota bacterium]MCY3696004.1 SDR family NAD(P)-dependent oxidoreductase [Chloroflexota bacterium]MXX30721.1 SDR family oxidoreductase [Chloroflexota bacterium]MYD17130.1 SDR family oxidoreductase [Chloroflexota bacterium]